MISAPSPRQEIAIFADLAALCVSPGYSHAIAYFCFRDHVVAFGDTLRSEDYARLFSFDRLTQLRRHCEVRKYSVKARKWASLLLEPGTGSIRLAGLLEFPWEQDTAMDVATAKMAPPQPIDALSSLIKQARKLPSVGRNEKCPCGSGKKYKKCHLLKGGWT